VQAAYRRQLRAAQKVKDQSRIDQLEAAHTSIMMSAFTARKQGGAVPNEIKYADKSVYFPWRPKKFMADTKTIQYATAAQVLMILWAVLPFTRDTAGTQPLLTSTMIAFIANAYKQIQIRPNTGEKNHTFANLARAALLTMMSTFIGCYLCYSLPDLLASSVFKKVLPVWFYASETMILAVGAAVFNNIFTVFFR